MTAKPKSKAKPSAGHNTALDFETSSLREINALLQSAKAGAFTVRHPKGAHAVGVASIRVAGPFDAIVREGLRCPLPPRTNRQQSHLTPAGCSAA